MFSLSIPPHLNDKFLLPHHHTISSLITTPTYICKGCFEPNKSHHESSVWSGDIQPKINHQQVSNLFIFIIKHNSSNLVKSKQIISHQPVSNLFMNVTNHHCSHSAKFQPPVKGQSSWLQYPAKGIRNQLVRTFVAMSACTMLAQVLVSSTDQCLSS